jgi:hypothetical protein
MKISQEQAIEILDATVPPGRGVLTAQSRRDGAQMLFDALATAGAFTDGAPLACEGCSCHYDRGPCAVHDPESSRPVATCGHWEGYTHTIPARAHICRNCQRPRDEHQARPIATCSKARAEEIRDATRPHELTYTLNQNELDHFMSAFRHGQSRLIDALDRAGFFADEATLAEIDRYASELLGRDPRKPVSLNDLDVGLRLATAVRKLGIGGGK